MTISVILYTTVPRIHLFFFSKTTTLSKLVISSRAHTVATSPGFLILLCITAVVLCDLVIYLLFTTQINTFYMALRYIQ